MFIMIYEFILILSYEYFMIVVWVLNIKVKGLCVKSLLFLKNKIILDKVIK